MKANNGHDPLGFEKTKSMARVGEGVNMKCKPRAGYEVLVDRKEEKKRYHKGDIASFHLPHRATVSSLARTLLVMLV
jgi:hypothetical protein